MPQYSSQKFEITNHNIILITFPFHFFIHNKMATFRPLLLTALDAWGTINKLFWKWTVEWDPNSTCFIFHKPSRRSPIWAFFLFLELFILQPVYILAASFCAYGSSRCSISTSEYVILILLWFLTTMACIGETTTLFYGKEKVQGYNQMVAIIKRQQLLGGIVSKYLNILNSIPYICMINDFKVQKTTATVEKLGLHSKG